MTPLAIDVFSDVVCPWCFIGSRRLAQALQSLGGRVAATVVYRPYLLNSATPPEGMDLREHLARKYGGDPERMFSRVEAAARSSGIPLDFAKVRRYGNTLKAHTLIRKALAKDSQAALVESLFNAYFLEGRNVGDTGVLADIALRHGFAPGEAEAALADAEEAARTREDIREAQAMGIQGVPFYVFANRLALSGAQAPETFVAAIEQALEEKPEAPAA